MKRFYGVLGITALWAVPSLGAPTITIGAPSEVLTGAGPVSYIVTYEGASSVTLADQDVTLNTGGLVSGTVTVTGIGPSARKVILDSLSGDGAVSISIAAGTAEKIPNLGRLTLAVG